MTTSFAELGLNEQILAGVDALGFTEPTPVQAQAIPLVLAGRDVVVSAQTGTGKTAAFALPTLQLVLGRTPAAHADAPMATAPSEEGPSTVEAGDEPEQPKRRRRRRRRRSKGGTDVIVTQGTPGYGPYALVITPTRELAQQIEKVASAVCEKTGQRAVIVMGGAKFDRQVKQLAAGCDLLVATPGRLIDLMDRKIVNLGQVEVLVLDEADRMLDMGFWPSVRRIMHAVPERRQTLLFSATIPPSIKSTIDAMLTDPATVEIARIGETADTVEEHLCPITQGQKTQLLQALLERDKPERVLVFCRTKSRVDEVSASLKRAGVKADVMHADRRQEAREKALARFRDGRVQVLVATDVMSRGIDVSGIDAVVNYDVPMDPEDYVHRIGRTGRAGATGHAYTFVAPDEITPLREIEYFTKKLVPVWDLEGFAYDDGRIVPNDRRSTTKVNRSLFSGSRSKAKGPRGGRYGRHY
ncbi:MAG: DEAD/DEAH box helicase [Atopobiaceae bacterium]|nr:DEAD/DEAH box helicase [Atopobiaceae bacterium]